MMNNENDNQDPLELFFSKKIREYEIPFREEDWQKMDHLLDVREMKYSYRKKIALVAAAAMFIISLLGFFTYQNYNKIGQLSNRFNDEIAGQAEEPPVIPPFPQSPESSPDRDSSHDETDANRIQAIPGQSEPTSPSEDHTVNDIATSGANVAEIESIQRLPITEFRQIDPQTITLTWNERSLLLGKVSGPNLAIADSYRPTDESRKSQRPGILTYDEPEQRADPISASRVTVGALISPDITTAGRIANFHETGYKIGMTAEYKLSRNVSITSGAVFSNVKYSANNRHYNVSEYENGYFSPDHIEGVCQIIDIPVSLKYNFLNFDRSRLFMTSSVSSYVMMSEDYNFTYQYDQAGLPESQHERSGKLYPVSNAGVSVGYELDLHQNWSLRAEPFLKIPLREVGWSNVKLYSMGGFMSLNIRL